MRHRQQIRQELRLQHPHCLAHRSNSPGTFWLSRWFFTESRTGDDDEKLPTGAAARRHFNNDVWDHGFFCPNQQSTRRYDGKACRNSPFKRNRHGSRRHGIDGLDRRLSGPDERFHNDCRRKCWRSEHRRRQGPASGRDGRGFERTRGTISCQQDTGITCEQYIWSGASVSYETALTP